MWTAGSATAATPATSGRALRAVVWERSAGQVRADRGSLWRWFSSCPRRFRRPHSSLAALVIGAVVGGGLLIKALPRNGRFRQARGVRALLAATSAPVCWRETPGRASLIASLVVVAGHVTTYLVAAHAVGVQAPVRLLLPLALLVLLAMAVPANIGGWGPREGVAAWAFAAAGPRRRTGGRDRDSVRAAGLRGQPPGRGGPRRRLAPAGPDTSTRCPEPGRRDRESRHPCLSVRTRC